MIADIASGRLYAQDLAQRPVTVYQASSRA